VTGGLSVSLSANGAGTGNGGSITLRATQSSLAIGGDPNQFILSATGGEGGSSAGDGGTIKLTAGTDMAVNMAVLAAWLLGTNGNGAQLSFTVSNGKLGIFGNLSADGAGTGAGGKITISVNSSTPFSIRDGDSVSGVSGVLHADAGSASGGDGGTVSITQSGSGGLKFCADSSLFLISAQGGAAGGNSGTIPGNTRSGRLNVGA